MRCRGEVEDLTTPLIDVVERVYLLLVLRREDFAKLNVRHRLSFRRRATIVAERDRHVLFEVAPGEDCIRDA